MFDIRRANMFLAHVVNPKNKPTMFGDDWVILGQKNTFGVSQAVVPHLSDIHRFHLGYPTDFIPKWWWSLLLPRGETNISITGWWFQTWLDYFPFHTLGMSSFPLTNSIIFQDGYCTTNQYNLCPDWGWCIVGFSSFSSWKKNTILAYCFLSVMGDGI